MLKVSLYTLSLAILCATALYAAGVDQNNYKPKDGYVPNEKTAIAIAVAVWEPIYGEKMIAGEKPYHAELDEHGVWHVHGSLSGLMLGGVAEADIAKDDGRILRVIHGK